MFWENFYNQCIMNGTTPTNVVEKLKIARGSVTKWKSGVMPSWKTISKIANYFDITVDYLINGAETETYNEKGNQKMSFWEIYVKECIKAGETPNSVAKKINASSASATKWKSGALPRSTTLQKIADFFGVSVSYLLTGNESADNNHIVGNGNVVGNNNTNCCNVRTELGEMEKEVVSLMRKMDIKQKNALLTKAYELLGE